MTQVIHISYHANPMPETEATKSFTISTVLGFFSYARRILQLI